MEYMDHKREASYAMPWLVLPMPVGCTSNFWVVSLDGREISAILERMQML